MLVIPVHNMAVLPNSVFYIKAEDFAKAAGRAAAKGERVILLFSKDSRLRSQLAADSFRRLAETGTVRAENMYGFTAIDTADRVGVDDVSITPDYKIQLSISARREKDDLSDAEEHERFLRAKKSITDFAEHTDHAAEAKQLASFCDNLNGLISVFAPFMMLSADERSSLLEENSRRARADRIE